MAFSSNKPYQRSSYRAGTDANYDRHLKETLRAGNTVNVKESMLEKPYKSKTYNEMQQEYNPVLPPTIEPGAGTGGLKCVWTSTGCEQLIGCWAGSDIILDGAEAATAGYQPIVPVEGEIVSQVISGSENRGIDIVMSPVPRRNVFDVVFKDGKGVLHTVPIDVTCSISVEWTTGTLTSEIRRCVIDSTGVPHTIGRYISHQYATWDGTTWTFEAAPASASYTYSDIVVDGSDVPIIAYKEGIYIKVSSRAGGSWAAGTTVYTLADVSDALQELVLLIDGSNALHIFIGVHPNSGDDYIRYITDISGSWADEEVITFSDAANESIGSIDVVASGATFHIAVTANYSGDDYLGHIYGSFGSWTTETVETYSSSGTTAAAPTIFYNGSILNIISSGNITTARAYLRHSIDGWTTNNVFANAWNISSTAVAAEGVIHCFAWNQYAYPAAAYRVEYFRYGDSGSDWSLVDSPLVADNSLECCAYDSVNGILHVFYSDTSVGYMHSYIYL